MLKFIQPNVSNNVFEVIQQKKRKASSPSHQQTVTLDHTCQQKKKKIPSEKVNKYP